MTSAIPKKPTAPPRKPQSIYVLPLLLAAVFVVGLMLIYKYRTKPVPPPPPPPIEAPVQNVAKTRLILISSQPSGATIWINNVNTGLITPSDLEVPMENNFVIMLQKTGYKPFVSGQVFKHMQGAKFTAVLSRPERKKKR